ncbi:MAG TPA: hypothetical protein ENK06_03450 [Gammaproteobacteria bacterium]|nr:hypothetical protein [Gammaproteobacteria bacterium]
MHHHQYPIVNNWYANLTGQLFKVRMVAYGPEGMGGLVIEYIDGSKQIISRQEWDCLKLMKHNSSRQKALAEASSEELTHS